MMIEYPGTPGYVAATGVFNLAAPVTPAAVVRVRSVADVRAALARATAANLGVRVIGAGHGSSNAPDMTGALLLRTESAADVEIDTTTRIARIPAGTRWGAVVDAAAPHGLAAPHGSSPLVGVTGYLLRGGISSYGRYTGVAANRVRAIELVTADGTALRVDASHEPELFWALRGGGGGFGVVTAIEVELFRAASVVTGSAWWPAEHADALLRLWLRWAKDAPPEATTTLRLMNLPQLPEIPEPLRAGTVVCVDGTVLDADGDPARAGLRAEELLGPLRAVAPPVFDTWHPGTPSEVVGTHMDPADPVPIFGDHLLLDDLPDEAAAALLGLVGADADATLTNAELRQLGGALAQPSATGGVFDHVDAPFAYLNGGVPFGVTPERIHARCAEVRAALTPWLAPGTAPSLVENLAQPQGHLSADQVAAVDRVRARVDPAGWFAAEISPHCSARQL